MVQILGGRVFVRGVTTAAKAWYIQIPGIWVFVRDVTTAVKAWAIQIPGGWVFVRDVTRVVKAQRNPLGRELSYNFLDAPSFKKLS